jgi:hypothetical protein
VAECAKIAYISYDITHTPPFDPSKPYEVVMPGATLPESPWVLEETRRLDASKFGAWLAIIPPIFSLVIGLSLGWVIKGFRT